MFGSSLTRIRRRVGLGFSVFSGLWVVWARLQASRYSVLLGPVQWSRRLVLPCSSTIGRPAILWPPETVWDQSSTNDPASHAIFKGVWAARETPSIMWRPLRFTLYRAGPT